MSNQKNKFFKVYLNVTIIGISLYFMNLFLYYIGVNLPIPKIKFIDVLVLLYMINNILFSLIYPVIFLFNVKGWFRNPLLLFGLILSLGYLINIIVELLSYSK